MFDRLEQLLLQFSENVSLEVFAVLGSFIEEIIAPIPSPLMMMTAGVLAEGQGGGLVYLVWIGFIAAIAKTLASWILYFVADKLEDVVLGKWGKFFGIEHSFVENVGAKLNKGIRDYFTIFVLRALPVVPSAPVSVLAGFFKVELKAYLVGTFLGTIVRNLIYLYIGFSGIEFVEKYHQGLVSSEHYVQIGLVGIVLAVIVYWKVLRK